MKTPGLNHLRPVQTVMRQNPQKRHLRDGPEYSSVPLSRRPSSTLIHPEVRLKRNAERVLMLGPA